jgi:hypothetical protein
MLEEQRYLPGDDDPRGERIAIMLLTALAYAVAFLGMQSTGRGPRTARRTPIRPPSAGCAPSSAAGRNATFADQLVELGAFLDAQPHYVFLDGNLFPDHESPPSPPCGDSDSELAVIFE